MNADTLATKLTDEQVKMLATVTIAMGGGPVPAWTIEQWDEAERLVDALDGAS